MLQCMYIHLPVQHLTCLSCTIYSRVTLEPVSTDLETRYALDKLPANLTCIHVFGPWEVRKPEKPSPTHRWVGAQNPRVATLHHSATLCGDFILSFIFFISEGLHWFELIFSKKFIMNPKWLWSLYSLISCYWEHLCGWSKNSCSLLSNVTFI